MINPASPPPIQPDIYSEELDITSSRNRIIELRCRDRLRTFGFSLINMSFFIRNDGIRIARCKFTKVDGALGILIYWENERDEYAFSLDLNYGNI